MLVSRKGTKNKRPVVDFRLLNTATPLLRDIFKMLGRSKCEVLSCVDPLSEEELQLTFEGIESSEYLTYQADIEA